ncbi:sensor histidine kinase [Trueperella pyogenes]|uniref:sensor histidine kinase n=1 Tax=Trueperella pyogenes TaxID=1661 RepID=UPI00215CC16C|nr:sensor histidine kinase [Trueperella pyogenes]UVJ59808.1 sensor histidine kinase [Trueperella pyogenes]
MDAHLRPARRRRVAPPGSAPVNTEAATSEREDRISQLLGLFMAVIWLAFLAFPIVEILRSEGSGLWKALNLGLLGLFAAAYVWGMVFALTRPIPFSDTLYRTSAILAALTAAIFAVFSYLNPGSLALGIFVVALVVITLPPRIGYTLGGMLTVFITLHMAWTGVAGALFNSIITFSVYIYTLSSSYFTRQGERETQTARREAALDERERVARDVHDVLGHTLTVISLKSELAAKLIDRDPARARTELLAVNELSRQAIGEVRATVAGLTNRSLATELATIRTLTSDVGLNLTITGSADDADPRHRILFGWVAREAMTNVVRHAKASAVRIEIGESWLSVVDDGVGLGSAAEGNGLRGLRHRVEDVGGKLTISPGPAGQGTKVEVRM